MNGIGQLLIKCIESFPPNFIDYEKDKPSAKEKCRITMRELKELLQEKRRVRSFINKVIFKYSGTNLAEIEMRSSGSNHYREILFVINKPKMMKLLYDKIPHTASYDDKVFVYGEANKKFGKWMTK